MVCQKEKRVLNENAYLVIQTNVPLSLFFNSLFATATAVWPFPALLILCILIAQGGHSRYQREHKGNERNWR